MRSVIFSLSLFLCLNLTAQNSKTIKSIWQENSEEDPDTELVDYFFQQKGNFYYFIADNEKYVWFIMKTSDTAVQNTILESGMTLWIDMDNKGGMKSGILYPAGSMNSLPKITDSPDERKNSNAVREKLVKQANMIELKGFPGEARRFPSDTYDNFRGKIHIDVKGTMYYYMRMPTIKLPLRNSRDGVGAMPFALGIQFGTEGNKSRLYWIKNIKLATGN